MKKYISFIYYLPIFLFSQNYTSYFTGNLTDIVTSPAGGVCLMGGATEDDNAMKWFLQRANGGDILVLRASGSNGYNNYLYSTLGVNVNSVETIVCNSSMASYDPYVLQKIQQAEGIWFAGGNQWTYISYWRNTPVDSLINIGIKQRNIVVGGTSAGMAIQGKYYFSAQSGTVSSATALANPYSTTVTVDSSKFLQNEFFQEVITDTHFDNPDRKGRLVTFLARILTDYGNKAKAIACDEYTSVCVDTNGIASVFGGYPTYDDNAYFIQTNCELSNQNPEVCTAGSALTWNLGGAALKVYSIKGTASGANNFNLNDWQNGVGGTWLNWSANSGVFSEQQAANPNCLLMNKENLLDESTFSIFPNPTQNQLNIVSSQDNLQDYEIFISNILGELFEFRLKTISNNTVNLNLENLSNGIYFLRLKSTSGLTYDRLFIKN